MKKFSTWFIVIGLIIVGAAGAIGYGYQKANDEGINGTVNIIASQAIGVDSITFGSWPETDDSAVATVSEDGLSYMIGLQLNNGDLYGGTNQEIFINLYNYAKTEMVVKLTTDFSITHPDPADVPCDDIHIWYQSNNAQNVIGQIDPWTYLIKLNPGNGLMEDIIDADGITTTTWGSDTDIDVTIGDPLILFEISDKVVTNNLNNPTDIWWDNDGDDTYDAGEPVILGNPGVDDPGVNAAIDPRWVFHDNNGDTIYNYGEDIIMEYDGNLIYSGTGGASIKMYVDVGNMVPPGFYTFQTFIEPTNWGNLNTANM